jgi:hypothetical protein
MAQYLFIRKEVHEYLLACQALLNEESGAYDQFILASQALATKNGKYTDGELTLIQEMLDRVSQARYLVGPSNPSGISTGGKKVDWFLFQPRYLRVMHRG